MVTHRSPEAPLGEPAQDRPAYSPTFGRVGIWTGQLDYQPADDVRKAVAEVEELGFAALWTGEAVGREVLTAAQLEATPHLIALFDGIRERPEIADGIRCNCGCAGMPGYYSLLSCYEGDAMARQCPICQGQGRLATRLHRAGKSLAEIRVAIDAQFDG